MSSATIAGEFANFDELNVRKFIPVCVSALVLRDPNVLTLAEITASVVPKDADGVSSFCGNGHVVESVTVEIANGDIQRIPICGVGTGDGSAGCCGKCGGGRQNHQCYKEQAEGAAVFEVVFGEHQHHCFGQCPLHFNAFALKFTFLWKDIPRSDPFMLKIRNSMNRWFFWTCLPVILADLAEVLMLKFTF